MDLSKRKPLGRGLSALIPQVAPSPAPERWLPIAEIAPNPWQPRTRFDDETLTELVASIREQGVIQPLLVRRGKNGWELVAGERRLRAARLAGLDSVPVVVRDLDDRQALEIALVENLQRQDLDPLEEASAYERLMRDFGLTQEEIAQRVGKSRPAVANTLRLLQLPEPVREELRRGSLSAGHARALLALSSPSEQIALAREAVRRRLSVRSLEARIQARNRPRPRPPRSDVHVAELESTLSRSLATRVRIAGSAQRGRISIEYYSAEELERLVRRLKGP
jgi:ParB family chromosome partitioning protein